uniref:Histone-lysine N-methyltransferase SETD2 n=1 Tax=Ditylenchus dipsaci TaxID=166011 RepID=A0A915DDK0_9BILA
MPQFTYLDECIILWKSTQKRDADSIRCICEPTKEEKKNGQGCGEDCLNRQLYMECGPGCPSGKYCTNKRFQKRLYANVEVFYTGAKGFGLKVNTPIKKGQFIIEYVGEVCDYDEMVARMKRYSKDPSHKHHYFMALSGGVIDATAKGNNSRFINHSCDPNSKTLKWNVNKQERIGFFAIKPIGAGEEITFNYQFERFGKRAQKCYCGSSNCTGYIGARNEDDDEEEEDDDDEGVESDYDEQSTSNTSSDGEEPEETLDLAVNKEKENEVLPIAVIEESLKSPVYQSPEKVPPTLIEPIESAEQPQQPVEVIEPKVVKTKEPKKPKTPRAPKQHTQPRKKKNNGIEMKKTYELAEVMEILNRGPMRNKEHVVEFNRLMVRVELTESREKMVEYLLKTEDKDIQRLFVANQGLALIRLWFTVPHEGEVIDWKLHNNIAKVLLKLPLVSKNQVLDTHILTAVEQLYSYELPDEIVLNDLMKEVVNKVADCTENNDDDVQSLHIPNPMIVELASLKSNLKLIISNWSKLSQFKIPKKDINVVSSARSSDHSSKNKEAHRRHYQSTSFASNKFSRRDSEDRYLNRRRPLNDLGSDWKDDGAETGHSPFSTNSFNNPNSYRNGRKSSFERSPPEAGPCIQKGVDQSLMNPSLSIPPSPHPTGNVYPQYEGVPLGYASAPPPYDPQYAGYMPFNPAGFMPSPMPMAPYFMGAHMVASPHFYPGAYMPHAGFPPPPPPRNSTVQAMDQKPADAVMTPEEWLKIVMANASAVATQANANLKAPDATSSAPAAANDQSDKELSDVEREVVPKDGKDSKKEKGKHKSGRDSNSKKNRHRSSKRSSSKSHGRKSRSSKSKHRSSSRSSSSSSSSSSFSSNSSKDDKRKRHSGSSSKHRHSSRSKSISLKKHWSASKSGDKKGSSSRHNSHHTNSNYKHGLSASNSLLKKSLRRQQQRKHEGSERSYKKHSSSSKRHSRHRSPGQEGRKKDKKKNKRRSSKSKSFSSSSTSCSSLGLPAAPVESAVDESVSVTGATSVALPSPLVAEVEDRIVAAAVEEQMADKSVSKKPASRFGQPFKLEEKKTIKMIINTKATDMLDITTSSSSALPPPQLIIHNWLTPSSNRQQWKKLNLRQSISSLRGVYSSQKIDGRAPIQMIIKPFGFASKVAKARLTKLASPPLPPTLELDDLVQAKAAKTAEREVCSTPVQPVCTTPVLPQAPRQEPVQSSSPINAPGSPPVDVQQPPVLHPYLLAKASSLDSYISALYQYIHTLEEFREGIYGSILKKVSNNLTIDVQPAPPPQEETAAYASEGDKRFLSTFSPIKRRHAPEVDQNRELPEKRGRPLRCVQQLPLPTTTTSTPINNPDVDNALTLAANYMSQNLPKSAEPNTPKAFTSDPRLLRGQVKSGPSRVVKQPVVTATTVANNASDLAQPAQTQVECVEKPVGKSGMWLEAIGLGVASRGANHTTKSQGEKPATTTSLVAAPKDTPSASTAARANFKQEIVSFAEKYMKPYRKRFFSSSVEFAHFLRKITKKVIESQDKCSNHQLDFNEGVQSSIKRLLEDYIRLFNKQQVLPPHKLCPPNRQQYSPMHGHTYSTTQNITSSFYHHLYCSLPHPQLPLTFYILLLLLSVNTVVAFQRCPSSTATAAIVVCK